MRIEGTVKIWNDDRGFGFIEPLNGGQDIFVHIKAFSSRTGRPELGQPVSFEIEISPDGKKRATRVEVIKAKRQNLRVRSKHPVPWGTATLLTIPAFLVLYASVGFFWKVPTWVASLYLGTSVLCFIVYAIDKSAATAERWRISENTLLWLGLIGGWPGAIVAQQFLRHKSTKASFRTSFWGTVIANLIGFVALNSPLQTML